MGKREPRERWTAHVFERFLAMKITPEFEELRSEGLAVFGRAEMLTAEEWADSFDDRVSSADYLEWHSKCEELGDRFGLAPSTVTMACLLEDYRPEEQPHVLEAEWPRVRVITESSDPRFIHRLCSEAQELGLYVVRRQGSVETTCLILSPEAAPRSELPASCKPPRDKALYMRVETPPGFPPEAASQLQKQAAGLGSELLRRLGYAVPRRLRASSLVSLAEQLEVGEGPLPSGGAYDIIDDVYGETFMETEIDQERRKEVGSRRHKLKKRLVEPYGKDD